MILLIASIGLFGLFIYYFALSKSIELLIKYEETGDESYIEQYMNLFKLFKKK